jgi:hypothetical protein
MKLTTDQRGRVVIEPDGNDSPVINGVPQGMIVVTRESTVIECWEQGGVILSRKVKATDLLERDTSPGSG